MVSASTAREEKRVLIYSHDSFGLGHLRRCRTIAEALVRGCEGLSVLIMSGSEVATDFDATEGVDVMKIPGIVKQSDGSYRSRTPGVDVSETMALRRKLIRKTAEGYRPDIFIVDKEPMGLRGEVEPTLILQRTQGRMTVLGLRDVMDAPEDLRVEWERKGLMAKTASLFDEVWVYGPRDFNDPLSGLDVPAHLRQRMVHTGFIDRRRETVHMPVPWNLPEDFVLATAGGGGDGDDIMLRVLEAREHDDTVPPLVLLVGPFMPGDRRAAIHARASGLSDVTVIDFAPQPEVLVARARAVVGMCGYNTFCELLSYDKPALYLPRTSPRKEQWVRARRAQELGLARMLEEEEAKNPLAMAAALKEIASAPAPSQVAGLPDMGGLPCIVSRVRDLLGQDEAAA